MNRLLCIGLATLLAAGWMVGASAGSTSKAMAPVEKRQGADNPPGDNRHGRGTDDLIVKRQAAGSLTQRSRGTDDPPGDNRGNDGVNHR